MGPHHPVPQGKQALHPATPEAAQEIIVLSESSNSLSHVQSLDADDSNYSAISNPQAGVHETPTRDTSQQVAADDIFISGPGGGDGDETVRNALKDVNTGSDPLFS